MPRAGFWVVLGLALVLEVVSVTALYSAPSIEEGSHPTKEERRVALAVALLVPVLPVALAWRGRIDGFTIGSAWIAAGLETFVFYGWVISPQHEPLRQFFIASVFPGILVLVTFLFYYLQREA